jgi:hypothetical protein
MGLVTPNVMSPELGDAFAQFCVSGRRTKDAGGRSPPLRGVARCGVTRAPRYLARRRWPAAQRLRPVRRQGPARSREEHPVGGASDARRAQVEDMRVDHRGADIAVAEELLDGPDVVVVLQQVGSEGLAKGVTCGGLGDARGTDCVEGYTNAGSRRGPVVLVQQSAEEIPATYVSGHRGAD